MNCAAKEFFTRKKSFKGLRAEREDKPFQLETPPRHSSIDMFTVIEAILIPFFCTLRGWLSWKAFGNNNSHHLHAVIRTLSSGASFLIKKVLISHAKLKFFSFSLSAAREYLTVAGKASAREWRGETKKESSRIMKTFDDKNAKS